MYKSVEGLDNHEGIMSHAIELKQLKECTNLSKRQCSLVDVCTVNDV